MSTERRLSRSFHSCLKGSSTEEAADDEDSSYHSLGGRHTLNRQPQVYIEDLTNVTLEDFESSQDDLDGLWVTRGRLVDIKHQRVLGLEHTCAIVRGYFERGSRIMRSDIRRDFIVILQITALSARDNDL
ncbi:unnamed protein product [Leptidea sinapis]|uniref:Uncharacterized protein n=1 Tax=Leptidea sinapis TaxID=189913 RepID=A0A5E4Q3U5_9NEOP|nr:unnamed protein product [Leptidea sinapis]